MGRGSANAFTDMVERIQAAYCLISFPVSAVQRDGNGVENSCCARSVLRQGQAGGEQPHLKTLLAQRVRNAFPLRIEQGLAAGQEHHAGVQLRKAGKQALHGVESHVSAAMSPVVAGDAARVAAFREIQRHQRQAMQVRAWNRVDQRLCRQSALRSIRAKTSSGECRCPDVWLGCNARICDRRTASKGVLIVKSE